MERDKKHIALWNVAKRECRRLVSRPLYLFCMVIAPLFCYIFFTTLMDSGLPTDMPVGVVDQDMTSTTRQLVRNLDAFEQTAVIALIILMSTMHVPPCNEEKSTVFSISPKVLPPKYRHNANLRFLFIPTTPCLLPVHSCLRI